MRREGAGKRGGTLDQAYRQMEGICRTLGAACPPVLAAAAISRPRRSDSRVGVVEKLVECGGASFGGRDSDRASLKLYIYIYICIHNIYIYINKK